jgi:hypothetical protein
MAGKIVMRISDAESENPDLLNEFGEDRIGQLQAAFAQINPAVVLN